MKYIVLALFLIAPFVSSASSDERPLWERIPMVESGPSMARACPLPWGLVTAAHVAFTHNSGIYVSGILMGPARKHVALDLALWALPPGMPMFEPQQEPIVAGDEVQIVGVKKGWAPAVVTGKLLWKAGGSGVQWIVSNTPGPGSSGSCAVSSKSGRVVGVATGGNEDPEAHRFIGVITPIDQLQPEFFLTGREREAALVRVTGYPTSSTELRTGGSKVIGLLNCFRLTHENCFEKISGHPSPALGSLAKLEQSGSSGRDSSLASRIGIGMAEGVR